MAPSLRYRPPPPPLLLVFLVAACLGDPFSPSPSPSDSGGTYNTSICKVKPYPCGRVDIQYPFYLSDDTGDVLGNGSSYCGHPGLAITCAGGEYPVLKLAGDGGGGSGSGSGNYYSYSYNVTGIDYSSYTISLADPDVVDNASCPRVDHNVSVPSSFWLNLTGSAGYSLIFFSNCSVPTFPLSTQPGIIIEPIPCLSHGGRDEYSFVLPSSMPLQTLSNDCEQVVQVPVLQGAYSRSQIDPANYSQWATQDAYRDVINQGFQLTWDIIRPSSDDPCTKCEGSTNEQYCAYNQQGEFVGCLCANGRVNDDKCGQKSSSATAKIVGPSVAAAVVGIAALAAALFLFMRKRKQKKVVNSSSKLLKYSGSGGTPRSRVGDMESGSIEDLPTHHFSYEELEEATDCFNDSRELGDGGFGTVYKGYLKDGRVVAVKRLYNNSYRRVEQFTNEAAILSGLRHPNLVMFYGCTSSQSRELLLVYEFVASGTVADHLHGDRASERALQWPLRLNIAVESAAALTYLHAIEPPVVHRDVKTTNILLDADFHVKVADFGLSRLFPLDVTHVSTAPQGTPGYVDPEYHQCYQLTDKSDVYSFGVVLVELISSKPAVDITRHRNEINLAAMAISKIQNDKLEQLVDMDLGYGSDPAAKRTMTMVAELAFRCLQQNSEMRPPIKEVLEVLRGIQGECRMEKDDGDKNKDDGPFSPNTVHAPWDSRNTTPNTSRD